MKLSEADYYASKIEQLGINRGWWISAPINNSINPPIIGYLRNIKGDYNIYFNVDRFKHYKSILSDYLTKYVRMSIIVPHPDDLLDYEIDKRLQMDDWIVEVICKELKSIPLNTIVVFDHKVESLDGTLKYALNTHEVKIDKEFFK